MQVLLVLAAPVCFLEIWLRLQGLRPTSVRSVTQVCDCLHLISVAHRVPVLADADPLGVNQNVTFDEVGGLDERKTAFSRRMRGFADIQETDIHSLKEMTLLPLLYPEVFQRFNLTPPRGVLFHGPPGTGKTLLARALAASCRANGKAICTSKFFDLRPRDPSHSFRTSVFHAKRRRLPLQMGR